jgi:hypothetical protein
LAKNTKIQISDSPKGQATAKDQSGKAIAVKPSSVDW